MAIITISRGSFSGGKLLAENLGEVLKYRVVSREILLNGAKKYGVSEERLIEALKTPPKFWDRLKHERRLYLTIIRAALFDEIEDQNIVYHGHAGHLLLKGLFQVIKVRVIAPFEYRVAMLVKSEKMNENEALRYIQKKDEERIKWTKFLYGSDWKDASLYDLVINLENLEIDCATELVKVVAVKKNEKLNESHRQAFANEKLISHIHAALALNPVTASAEIEIMMDDGKVKLLGTVQGELMVEKIIREVEIVAGVKNINRDEFVGLER